MYFSFIRPLLVYEDIIWDNCCNYEKFEIEKIQIEAGRIITGTTNHVRNQKFLKKQGRIVLKRGVINMVTFFKMVKGYAPTYLQIIVPPSVHQVSQRNLRNNQNLTVPRARTNLYNNSFIPVATREWNLLSSDAKNGNLNGSLIGIWYPFHSPTVLKYYLKGCPLYSDNVNGETFLAVQNFILNSNIFE